ncbi:hypothetical protein HNP38_002147 [Chryseobacterium defluvii]|uniref:Uncharacterized protein n=1 Tax=Chryseobacterium defluvii TaxID=160396 RepID=A0A840KBR3_9FLAO|nr:hypothetical protein [Chryseobacterium defluvii]MBB4806851.1 hypothetical protein [Chryseobacterium defluvii]
MYTFTVLPSLIIVTFIIVTLYKHYIRKQNQNLRESFGFVLFFVAIWSMIYYFVFS